MAKVGADWRNMNALELDRSKRHTKNPEGMARDFKLLGLGWDPATESRSYAGTRWGAYNADLAPPPPPSAEAEAAQIRERGIERRRKGLSGLITTSLLGVLGGSFRGGRKSLLGD